MTPISASNRPREFPYWEQPIRQISGLSDTRNNHMRTFFGLIA